MSCPEMGSVECGQLGLPTISVNFFHDDTRQAVKSLFGKSLKFEALLA
jgi:hypothetical protein